MVGHPPVQTTNMDDSFKLLYRNIWGEKIILQSNIPVFTQGNDLEKHISICEKE